jgi:hypothetical protein
MGNLIGAFLRYLGVQLRNVLAGTRLMLFLPVRSTAFRFSNDDIIGQFLIGLGTVLVLGMVTLSRHPVADYNRMFNAGGVTLVLSTYFILALGCYLAVRVSGSRQFLAPLVLVTFSVVPAFLIAGYVVFVIFDPRIIYGYWDVMAAGGFLWLALAAGRAVHMLSGARAWVLLVSACLIASFAMAPIMLRGHQPVWQVWKKSKWTKTYVDIEKTYYQQHKLLARALEGVAAGRAGVPEYFFVGFGAWASEDVFMNETRAAVSLFQRRFGAKGRTLVLINNPDTLPDVPLASVSNLRGAINAIAKKMNRDEDVLFLYVTSHGSTRSVAVRHGRLALNDLRAKVLRRILDEAGIKNRVLAISACYSGSFVKPLHNENTLIMTASAADRTSFGCGHDGTFTYFGNALIGNALEKEYAVARAFDIAARSIAAREKNEKLKPSKPQIQIGKKIGPVLDALVEYLRRNPSRP